MVVLLFELANFFFRIVASEQFEKAFENASALFRHGGGCRRARVEARSLAESPRIWSIRRASRVRGLRGA